MDYAGIKVSIIGMQKHLASIILRENFVKVLWKLGLVVILDGDN